MVTMSSEYSIYLQFAERLAQRLKPGEHGGHNEEDRGASGGVPEV